LKPHIASLFLLLLTTLIIGCVDSPTSVGEKVLPPGDYPISRIDTFYATDHNSKYSPINSGLSDQIMIGKFQYYEAWACIKFTDLPQELIDATITNAIIKLSPSYTFGDSTSQPSFEAYRLKIKWDSLSEDLLQKNLLQQNSSIYYEPVPLSIQISYTGDTLSIQINDTSMLREWFSASADSLSLNEGIILKPKSGNVIKGFYSFANSSYKPTLTVEYQTQSDTGSYEHTAGYSKFIPYVDSLQLITNDNYVYVQNGVSFRGLLKFDSLKFAGPYDIINAEMQITLDSSMSSIKWQPFLNNSIYVSLTSDDGASYYYLPVTNNNITEDQGNRTYSFNIRDILKYCRARRISPSMLLFGYKENECFDLFTFYGAGSSIPKKLQPKIIIYYSINN